MPAGLGKTIKIAVFAQGSYNKDAYDNGADYVIADQESAKDFINGPLDVDAIIATPDIMSSLMKWGVSKVIGPKGLMPNAKLDTVTFNIKKCIEDLRKGKAIFKNDKAGYLHAGIGKLTLETQALTENVIAFISGVEQAKPAVIKTNLIHSVWISASMCPAIKLNASQITRCIGNNLIKLTLSKNLSFCMFGIFNLSLNNDTYNIFNMAIYHKIFASLQFVHYLLPNRTNMIVLTISAYHQHRI